MVFEIDCYLFISYILVVIAVYYAWRYFDKHFTSRIKVVIVMLLMCLPLIPYAVVEIQTVLFYRYLKPAVYEQLSAVELPGLYDLKILYITPWSSKVYTVTDCEILVPPFGSKYNTQWEMGYAGAVESYKRIDGKWTFASSDGVWSDGGSMDGNIFPPYPNKGCYKPGSLNLKTVKHVK